METVNLVNNYDFTIKEISIVDAGGKDYPGITAPAGTTPSQPLQAKAATSSILDDATGRKVSIPNTYENRLLVRKTDTSSKKYRDIYVWNEWERDHITQIGMSDLPMPPGPTPT